MNEKIKVVTDASFEADVINSPKAVLIDFWAPWCGPCKALAPVMDEIAEEYDGQLIVAKMNVDDNKDTPSKYGIRGIPTVLLFKEGSVQATKMGLVTKVELSAFIDANI